MLTTFLIPLCVLVSWKSIHERVKEFFILLLVLETAMIGVFISLDLFLFYFFWESTLIPMALHHRDVRPRAQVYAAVKFFLYTMIASVFMLAAILWLYAKTGSFDFRTSSDAIRRDRWINFAAAAPWLFLGFFIAFAVKVPLFPFHTWLPDAHVEAPTAGSVLLAGVLLKMGTYGLLRFNMGLFPEQSRAQRLVDHDSGDHWHHLRRAGCHGAAQHEEADRLLLGQPPRFRRSRHFQLHPGWHGWRVYHDASHGVSTGALFMLARNALRPQAHLRDQEFGGLATPMPVYATFFLLIVLASIGLPLMNGFIGEFLVLSGAFQARAIYGILAASGVIWSACYLLWMYQRVFFGKVTHDANKSLPDLDLRERIALVPAAALALVMGVAPLIWLNAISPAVQATLANFPQEVSRLVGQ